jgi:hypothetical protein
VYTVKLTHGSDREVVSTTQVDVVNLTQVVDAATNLLQRAQQAGGPGAPDGYLVFDEHGHEVASGLTGPPPA